MAVSRSAGALAWRRCLRRSLCPSWVLLSPWCSRRRVQARARSPYLARACLRVWAYHLLFLCPRACGLCVWWRWRPLWWRVAPVSRFRGVGRPSYHRFVPLGIPSYHSCFVPRCWRLLVVRVFFGGVHISCGLWRLPPAFMAYGERLGGGFHGISSVGVVYFLLEVRPWSFYPRGDCCGGFGLVLLCHTLFVFACTRGHTTLALFVPSGLRFVCLVAVVCSPAACGSLPSVSRGFPSYHHFFMRGLPTRYAPIPSLFRSAVLVASCSSCVLWRCPHSLRRWRPIGCACSGKEKGWRFL